MGLEYPSYMRMRELQLCNLEKRMLGVEGAGILPVCTNTWYEGIKKMETDF